MSIARLYADIALNKRTWGLLCSNQDCYMLVMILRHTPCTREKILSKTSIIAAESWKGKKCLNICIFKKSVWIFANVTFNMVTLCVNTLNFRLDQWRWQSVSCATSFRLNLVSAQPERLLFTGAHRFSLIVRRHFLRKTHVFYRIKFFSSD